MLTLAKDLAKAATMIDRRSKDDDDKDIRDFQRSHQGIILEELTALRREMASPAEELAVMPNCLGARVVVVKERPSVLEANDALTVNSDPALKHRNSFPVLDKWFDFEHRLINDAPQMVPFMMERTLLQDAMKTVSKL